MNNYRSKTIVFGFLLATSSALHAQDAVDISVGFGTNHAPAASGGLDNANSTLNAFGSCAVGTSDPNCQALSAMSGLFMRVGGDFMFTEHFGAGFGTSFQPARQDYGPFQYRQTFLDVDGIYSPKSTKKWATQIIGGIGSARTSFSYTQTGCAGTAVCSTQTSAVGSSSNFAVHAGAAIQFFVWGNVFIKPEFSYHYVPNLTNQFGSSSVAGAFVSIGYGSHR